MHIHSTYTDAQNLNKMTKLHDDIHKRLQNVPFFFFQHSLRLFTTPPVCLPFLAELKACHTISNALAVDYQIPTPFKIKPNSIVIVHDSAPDNIGT